MALKDRDEGGIPKRIRLRRVGRIRQGEMRDGRPVATPYFIIDPSTKDERERYNILEDVYTAIRENAPEQDMDNITILPIKFMASVDDVIGPEAYKKRVGKKGTVWCAGDGEFIQWKLDKDFRVEIAQGEPETRCPGGERDPDKRHEWCDGCGPEIELNFTITGYESLGTWMLRSSSMNLRDNFWTTVRLIQQLVGAGVLDNFVGIPFLLIRKVETVSAPGKEGKIMTVDMPITTIDVDRRWLQGELRRHKAEELPMPEEVKQIEAPQDGRPWYIRAMDYVPERPWTPIQVATYITEAMSQYRHDFEDADDLIDPERLNLVQGILSRIYVKQEMSEKEAQEAVDIVFWYFFDNGPYNIAQCASVWRWGREGDGSKVTQWPDFEQECLGVLSEVRKMAEVAET